MQLSDETITRILEHYQGDEPWDWCREYGEPGYPGSWAQPVNRVVLGDYWVRKGQHRTVTETDALTSWDRIHPRLWAQMETQGVQFEWCDEWVIDYESGKAYRSQPDSYGWTPSIVYDEYGDMLTPDTDLDEWLAWAVNEETRALTGTMVPNLEHKLRMEGWSEYNGEYQNGWYEGQNDTPQKAIERIRRDHGDVDYLFAITGVGQFDMHFRAWIKLEEEDENEDG